MNETALTERIWGFACDLIECSGGIAEWQPAEDKGEAIVSPQVAQCLGQTDETIALSLRNDGPGLSLNIAGNFLELAGKTLQECVPGRGVFAMNDLSVKKSDFQQTIDSAFGWQNARARILSVGILPVTYHAWWFQATLRSDDAWETLVPTTINCESGLEIPFGNILESIRFAGCRNSQVDVARSQAPAIKFAERTTMKLAQEFLARVDKRILADRRRLRDYYGAMLKESLKPNRRTKVVQSAEQLADRERAVKLELKRKLSELDERFAIAGSLRPIAIAECQIPSSVIELEIQRKALKRVFRVYWNGLTRKLEPLACSICGEGSFNLWFTNEQVAPVCSNCNSNSNGLIPRAKAK